MRYAILATLTLSACTAAPALILTAEQVQRMCQADPATAQAIAERYAHLTPLDGAAIVERYCAEPVE